MSRFRHWLTFVKKSSPSSSCHRLKEIDKLHSKIDIVHAITSSGLLVLEFQCSHATQ